MLKRAARNRAILTLSTFGFFARHHKPTRTLPHLGFDIGDYVLEYGSINEFNFENKAHLACIRKTLLENQPEIEVDQRFVFVETPFCSETVPEVRCSEPRDAPACDVVPDDNTGEEIL